MKSKDGVFDDAYSGDSTTTLSTSATSELKKVLKEPIPAQDIKRYGESKPTRLIIKARIIDGKS
jgi:hypothetical protein